MIIDKQEGRVLRSPSDILGATYVDNFCVIGHNKEK